MTDLKQSGSTDSGEEKEVQQKDKQQYLLLLLALLLFGSIVSARFLYTRAQQLPLSQAVFMRAVLPSDGITLPIRWGNLGKQLLETGIIDEEKILHIYANRGGLDETATALLYGENNSAITITTQNSGFLLNMLWAFGLANKNPILESGPMADPRYGNPGNFASTGGWTIASGSTMNHYSAHPFVILTKKQQELVELVSKNIYRPCCGNSTYFPDCNHGMAMLGLLELMASSGATEEEMYAVALQVNAYWFPDTYLAIAKYFKHRGVDWDKVNPKEILGSAYSSAEGYRQVLSEVEATDVRRGGSCGI